MLIAFQMFAARLGQPLLRLVGLYQQFQEASIAVRRLADIMDAPEEPHTLASGRLRRQTPAALELQGLGFRYGCERPWLFRDLTLSVAPGRALAIMGPSGCGKSTLARLLLGLCLPVEGTIAIDGIDLRHLGANEIRNPFGVVPQETVLFSGTILENVLAGEPGASLEDVVRACKAAEIHELIEHLPQGYQTGIGERGVGLSGGQKQRLAIARALLRHP
ncbi:MAG: ABC transporter, partial [Rhodocyclales bacterium CG_4_9_14_3_um_filter_68_10]